MAGEYYEELHQAIHQPKEFYAWGFDVMQRECLFHMRGKLTEFAGFTRGGDERFESDGPSEQQGQLWRPIGLGAGPWSRQAEHLAGD